MQRIRQSQATLIDFRNHIFLRKARLLTHLSRSEDLAKAALDYVQVGYAGVRIILSELSTSKKILSELSHGRVCVRAHCVPRYPTEY